MINFRTEFLKTNRKVDVIGRNLGGNSILSNRQLISDSYKGTRWLIQFKF